MDEISVWNDNQKWAPVSIEGNVLVFSLQSVGGFYIYDNGRNILFEFTNNMPQLFTVDGLYLYSEYQEGVPGTKFSDGPYLNVRPRAKKPDSAWWIKSTGTNIRSFDLSATNNAVVTQGYIEEGVSDDYRLIKVDYTDCQIGQPVSIFIGDVLVAYVEEITG